MEIGYSALTAIEDGDHNTCIGSGAGDAITDGYQNTLVGFSAGGSLTTPQQNVAIGRNALTSETTSRKNTAIGTGSLSGQNGADTDSLNVALGYDAGDAVTTGTNNTLIGASSDPSASGGTNQTVVGYATTGIADNSVTIGNASVKDVYMAQDSGAAIHCGAVVNGLAAVNVSTSTLAYDTHQVTRGKYVTVSADAQTVTLPAVQVGAVFIIVNIAADGGALLTIDPNGNDKFLTDIAGGIGTDGNTISNTKGTQNQGDFVKLVGLNGDGWMIDSIGGIWADE